MTQIKQNAVHKADVKVGSTYAVKVNGRVVPVTIDSIRQVNTEYPVSREVTQWSGLNRQTGNRVTIKSAAKLRYELTRGWLGSLEQGNWRQGWVRKDSPIVFELVEADSNLMPPYCYLDGTKVLRDWSREELAAVCGEDAPERCQEFEDESGRWHRV